MQLSNQFWWVMVHRVHCSSLWLCFFFWPKPSCMWNSYTHMSIGLLGVDQTLCPTDCGQEPHCELGPSELYLNFEGQMDLHSILQVHIHWGVDNIIYSLMGIMVHLVEQELFVFCRSWSMWKAFVGSWDITIKVSARGNGLFNTQWLHRILFVIYCYLFS